MPNEEGLKFYDNVINELLKYNIEPLVTISHYENPLHLSLEYGGWKNRKLIDFYINFAKVLFTRYKGKLSIGLLLMGNKHANSTFWWCLLLWNFR